MDTSVSIRRQNYWGPSWNWLLEPDTVRFLIFVFLVSVSPLIFPLICIPSLHFTHSLNFSSLDSFILQQFLIPYFILTQWVTGDTEASHVCFLTFQSSSLEQEHSTVFLSLLKATPNISRTWFRPQDFSETCFSTLIHHQTTNLTPKALMYSRCCWSFQVETKECDFPFIWIIRSHCGVINWPNFNIIISQGTGRPKRKERDRGKTSLWSSQSTMQHLLSLSSYAGMVHGASKQSQ